MIIELPRNAHNETQRSCRTFNMAQKGHSSVQNDPQCGRQTQWVYFSIKSNQFAFCSVQAELSSRAPLLQAVHITLKPVVIVKTFNGYKIFEIIGIAQGGNMLTNSQDEPKMAA
jgi:hypothetical protein